MPRALIFALITVIVVYVLVALVAVAAQPWQEFEGQEAGLAQILENIVGSTWPGTIIAAGAVISIFSVTLVTLYGQTRILFAMGRDGMLPTAVRPGEPRRPRPRCSTPSWSRSSVSILAAFVPLDKLADLVSIGTLVAFIVVSVGVIILRRIAPDLPRGFKVPGYPVTPVLAVIACVYVLSGLVLDDLRLVRAVAVDRPDVLPALGPPAFGAESRRQGRRSGLAATRGQL